MSDKIILMFGNEVSVAAIKVACEEEGLKVGENWFVVVDRTKTRTATLRRWRDEDKEVSK